MTYISYSVAGVSRARSAARERRRPFSIHKVRGCALPSTRRAIGSMSSNVDTASRKWSSVALVDAAISQAVVDLASAERALLLLGGDVEAAVPPHLVPEPPGSPRRRFGLGDWTRNRLSQTPSPPPAPPPSAARADGGRLEPELRRAQVGAAAAGAATTTPGPQRPRRSRGSAPSCQRDGSEARRSGPADVSAGAAARSLPRCGDAGSDDARLGSNARAADARRPTAPRACRCDCPEERADGRRLGG